MSTKAYVPPHRRYQNNDNDNNNNTRQKKQKKPQQEAKKSPTSNYGGSITTTRTRNTTTHEVDVLLGAFTRVCCINLRRREDRWNMFLDRLRFSLGGGRRGGESFVAKVERFDAVDGAELLKKAQSGCHPGIDDDPDMPTMEWDASNNALYDRHIQPPMTKLMTPGEVGCAMSHVKLWRELSTYQNDDEILSTGDSTMLILEDDAEFYRGKSRHWSDSKRDEGRGRGAGRHDKNNIGSHKKSKGFLEVFSSVWSRVPQDWEILYLGISDRGERIPVGLPVTSSSIDDSMQDPTISIFRPSYGFHTHAYALNSQASLKLLSNLPVVGPLDVWLADNNWFGLNVYCAVVANEGWHGQGAPLIGQRKHDTRSDIRQSGRYG